MDWFWKILLQGVTLATIVTLAAALDWFPLKLFFAVLAIYILFFILRNPRFFYRRGFQLILIAAVLPPSLRIRAEGTATLPDDSGFIHFLLELGQAPPAIWIGLAILCLIGDLAGAYREAQRRKRTYPAAKAGGRARLLPPVGGQTRLRIATSMRVPIETTLSGATIRILTPWPRALGGRIISGREDFAPRQEAAEDESIRLAANVPADLTVEADISGRYERWIRFRAGAFGGLLPLRALLVFSSTPGLEPLPIVVEGTSQQARARSAR